jgi:hypothetical protein
VGDVGQQRVSKDDDQRREDDPRECRDLHEGDTDSAKSKTERNGSLLGCATVDDDPVDFVRF